MQPMLATAAKRTPGGAHWAHEVKWDGMRLLVDISSDGTVLTSRSGANVTSSFPELRNVGTGIADALLDGELVALRDGRPSFHDLGRRMHVREPERVEGLLEAVPVTLMVFDVLRLLGKDIIAAPWAGRRDLLERLELSSGPVSVPAVFDDGEVLFAATAEQGLEGIVSKRRDSVYRPGRRSPDWLKRTHRRRESLVVGGWRPEEGSAERLGALLVGAPQADGSLRFAGRVGSGLASAQGRSLAGQLRALAAPSSPFAEPLPPADADGARWCAPDLVIDVEHQGHTDGGRLRAPSFVGVRPDLGAADLTRGGKDA